MKKIITILLLALGLAILATKYKFFDAYDKKQLRIGDTVIQVEIADTMSKQYLGLSNRTSLCADCGMLFVFEKSSIQTFVMRNMKFPLDMIFMSGNRVNEIWKNIPSPKAGEEPQYIQSLGPADEVLEVNAGFSDLNNLKIGNTAELTR